MELNDEIVNKGIAEFMGYEVVTWNEPHIQGTALFNKEKQEFITGNYYTESLDALVPVWEKLKYARSQFNAKDSYTFIVDNQFPRFNCGYRNSQGEVTRCGHGKTIQQAAAYATYKAIVELEK